MKNDAKLNPEDDFEFKELTENEEKIDKLSDKHKEILESVKDWLRTKRNYREHDFSADFVAEKLIPLIKFVEHDEIVFSDEGIIQKLRSPIEMTNNAGDVIKKLTELKYRLRYQDFELHKYTRGINIQKEQFQYINAQIALLTDTARSVIGKLWDIDSNNTKLIVSLYFLG